MKTQRIKTLLLFLSMIPFIGIYAQSIYYVSPHASSGGDGSQSAPFHSIHEAVEKARKDQNSTTIYLREGKYVLDKPLMLTSDDGNDSKELIIKNYPGEKTVLSSGIVLDLKWEKYKNGIMRAVVKGSPVMDMLTGAIWAKEAWGHYWAWDPKETWAAATWFSYLTYIHFRLGKPLKVRPALVILLVSFVLLQMCWYGINYLPSAQGVSVHTYNLN